MPKTSKISKERTSSQGRETSAGMATDILYPERVAATINLIEIRPGLFLNVDHIVSVRVLPQEDDNAYGILQLSNGDKLNITRGEFTMITGEEPRQLARLPQNPPSEIANAG